MSSSSICLGFHLGKLEQWALMRDPFLSQWLVQRSSQLVRVGGLFTWQHPLPTAFTAKGPSRNYTSYGLALQFIKSTPLYFIYERWFTGIAWRQGRRLEKNMNISTIFGDQPCHHSTLTNQENGQYFPYLTLLTEFLYVIFQYFIYTHMKKVQIIKCKIQ